MTMCASVFMLVLHHLQPLVLAALLAAYAGIDARALKLGVVFRYWAKVHAPTHMQYGCFGTGPRYMHPHTCSMGVPVLGQGTVYT